VYVVRQMKRQRANDIDAKRGTSFLAVLLGIFLALSVANLINDVRILNDK